MSPENQIQDYYDAIDKELGLCKEAWIALQKERDEARESLRKSEARVAELLENIRALSNERHSATLQHGSDMSAIRVKLSESEAAREQLREAVLQAQEFFREYGDGTPDASAFAFQANRLDHEMSIALSSTPDTKPVDGITDTERLGWIFKEVIDLQHYAGGLQWTCERDGEIISRGNNPRELVPALVAALRLAVKQRNLLALGKSRRWVEEADNKLSAILAGKENK